MCLRQNNVCDLQTNDEEGITIMIAQISLFYQCKGKCNIVSLDCLQEA